MKPGEVGEWLAGNRSGERWAVFWKQDYSPRVVSHLFGFGLSMSAEEALVRVEKVLRDGRPGETASEFTKKWQGGAFYAYPTHLRLPVPQGCFHEEDVRLRRIFQDAVLVGENGGVEA